MNVLEELVGAFLLEVKPMMSKFIYRLMELKRGVILILPSIFVSDIEFVVLTILIEPLRHQLSKLGDRDYNNLQDGQAGRV